MTVQRNNESIFFDDIYCIEEQLPRIFTISFKEIEVDNKKVVRVILNDSMQLGDIIDDNSYENDYYRYHDIFHYTFASILGWSPCARAMMKRKRKSDIKVDKIEDGARAAITEEAISMIIFYEAKKKEFYENNKKVSKKVLRIIKEMTQSFEVRVRSENEWQTAISQAYKIFRLLIKNNGGTVAFNSLKREIIFHK